MRRASRRSTTPAVSAHGRRGCSTTRWVRSKRSRRCSRRAWWSVDCAAPAVVFDQSPVGRRYAECFEAARARLGLEVTGTASISSLAEDAADLLDPPPAGNPDVLVYFGLGVSSRAVALARMDLGWDLPVLANSALMFGSARPTGATATRAGSTSTPFPTTTAAGFAEESFSPRAAGGPIGYAAYDIGRLLGEAIAQADHLTRAGIADGLRARSSFRQPAATTERSMGFGTMAPRHSKATTSCCTSGATGRASRSPASAGGMSVGGAEHQVLAAHDTGSPTRP